MMMVGPVCGLPISGRQSELLSLPPATMSDTGENTGKMWGITTQNTSSGSIATKGSGRQVARISHVW